MTAAPSVETPTAPRGSRLGLFGQEGTAGFILRVLVLLIAIVGFQAA